MVWMCVYVCVCVCVCLCVCVSVCVCDVGIVEKLKKELAVVPLPLTWH